MIMSGGVRVHLATVQREAEAAILQHDGSLAVWDELPEDWSWHHLGGGIILPMDSSPVNGGIVEADAIIPADSWEKAHKESSYVNPTSSQAMKAKAAKREDVDEDVLDGV